MLWTTIFSFLKLFQVFWNNRFEFSQLNAKKYGLWILSCTMVYADGYCLGLDVLSYLDLSTTAKLKWKQQTF